MKIARSLLCLTILTLMAACASPVKPPQSVEVRTVQVKPPAPIVPEVDQLTLRPVKWVILTPENIDEKFAEIKEGELVFFALTADGYENLALNISDIRANIAQYQKIIAIYKSQF